MGKQEDTERVNGSIESEAKMSIEGLKKLMIDAINSSPGTRNKIKALKSGKLGSMLQCYKDTVDELCPGKDEFERYMREKILLSDIVSKPQKTRTTLTTWAKSEVWQGIIKKTGKCPDESDFTIAFQQILEEQS